MKIITGRTGQPHITSQQQRDIYAAMLGEVDTVLKVGNKLSAELKSNNLIRINDGQLSMHGCIAGIEVGEYDELFLENGTVGKKRADLVVAHYTRQRDADELYIESVVLEVIKGNETVYYEGSPIEPLPKIINNKLSIRDGAIDYIYPIYQVNIKDLAISEIKPLFTTEEIVVDSQKVLWQGAEYMKKDQVAQLNESVSSQKNGIVLLFSTFSQSEGTAKDQRWSYHFIPRFCLKLGLTGYGTHFDMGSTNFSQNCRKYLYLRDTYIEGADDNVAHGTSSGITYDNRNWVLRYVLGV